jgi:hypothetical protein
MKTINSATIIITMIILSGITALAGNPELPVGLGSSGNFAILAKSGISTTTGSQVTGDMGVSPIDSTAITGFSLSLDSTTTFSTSIQVTGKIYAANYSEPTPTMLTTSVSNMETAYTDAAGRTIPDYTELGTGNISGMTLTPGLYKWSTPVLINTDVTLAGGPGDVWIFQIEGNLTVAGSASVLLSGGAQAGNIFWQVAGGTGVTIGTSAHIEGVILAQNAINMITGASMNGRLLAQKDVTLQSNAVTEPADPSAAMELRSADEVSGLFTYTSGQFIDFAIKSITAPQEGTNQFYSIWADTNMTISGFSITNNNIIVTYE